MADWWGDRVRLSHFARDHEAIFTGRPRTQHFEQAPIKFCRIPRTGSSEITCLGSGNPGVLERDN